MDFLFPVFPPIYSILPKSSQLYGISKGREVARQENKYSASVSSFCVPKVEALGKGVIVQGQRQCIWAKKLEGRKICISLKKDSSLLPSPWCLGVGWEGVSKENSVGGQPSCNARSNIWLAGKLKRGRAL